MARSATQSAQRYPLTHILGTEANVRLLRELSRHGGQLSASTLVLRTGLARTSVWTGVATLASTGFVTVSGTGRARLYNLAAPHPLRAALDALFSAEEQRFDAIMEAVREAARSCAQHARSIVVWLYGSVARGEDGLDGDLDIAVIADADALAAVLSAMRDALHLAGERLGFTASLVGTGTEDIAQIPDTDPFWGRVKRDAVVLYARKPHRRDTPDHADRRVARRDEARRRTSTPASVNSVSGSHALS